MKRILTVGGIGFSLTLLLNSAYSAEWTQPMTSWGEPDIQGTWPINHLIGVPMQRDPKFGERLYLNDEEFAEEQASVAARDERFQTGPIPQADAAGFKRATAFALDRSGTIYLYDDRAERVMVYR